MTRTPAKQDAAARARRAARRGRRARRRRGRARGGRGRARRDRPPAHRAQGDRLQAHRPHVRADQPPAHGGHRPPARRRARRRRPARSSRRATRAGRSPARGGPVKTEDDPLDPAPAAARCAPTLDAIRHVERAVTAIDWGEGVVLRYGGFYGPGTNLSSDPRAEMAEVVRKRKFPLVGDGARRVVVRAHRRRRGRDRRRASSTGRPGIYQVVDDEPAPVREWLPALAQRARRQAAAARAALARPARRRRGRDRHDDRGARRVEREGQARARLAAASTRAGGRGFAEGLG